MEALIIILVVICGGIGGIFWDGCRRQKYGLSLDERYKQTMADLDREVRRDINEGVISLRQECQRMEAQKQRNAELRQQYPELYREFIKTDKCGRNNYVY